MILKAKSHDARVAYSAEEGMVVAETFRPHVVISDVVMGEKSGSDLAVYLTEEQPG